MGPPIQQLQKSIIFKVHRYFLNRKADKESNEHKMDMNINKLVAEATGVSPRTVMRIVSEGRTSQQSTGQVKFSAPQKPKEIKKKINIDNIHIEVIQNKIHQFNSVHKKMPSIRKLNAMLKQDGIVNCGDTYLRNLLHQMGYSFGKSKSNKQLVTIEIPLEAGRRGSADSRTEDAESDSNNLTSGCLPAGVDSSGEYSDFDDEQAETGGKTKRFQVEVDQNEGNYDVCKNEPLEDTYNEEDRGRFVSGTNHNMPEVNMFAVVEYICKNERGLKRLDYPMLKLLTKNNPDLITSIKVAHTEDTCRLRGTVNFDRVSSHMCEVEYSVCADIITSSECVCGNNPCEHVAAFLMWLAHKPTTDNTESEQVHTSSECDSPLLNELEHSDSFIKVEPSDSDDVGPSTSRSDSNMEVVIEPSAKRQRIAPATEDPAAPESAITVVPLPKDENEPGKSKIQCSFPRKTINTLWNSATGSCTERSGKILTILKMQLRDDNYITDFSPLEERIEQLCVLFDKMKNKKNKSENTEFMNTKEVVELERVWRKNNALKDPLN